MSSINIVPQNNNLDIVRFTLASMVFISHAHDLSGLSALALLSAAVSSTLAVQAFFIISGFLIFQSFDRSSTLKSYAARRVRRILPAYVVVVISCAVLLGALSTLPFGAYVRDPGLWRYLGANLLFLNFLAPELPGVFQNNLFSAVNGALWTLKIEVAFYVSVPICVWLCRRYGRDLILVLIYLLSVAYAAGCLWLAETRGSGAFVELSRQLPGQMTYFVAGAACYYHFGHLRQRPWLTAAAGLILFGLSTVGLELALRPIGLALLVMGISFGPFAGRFGRHGDFSYGIYIIHFPVLQTLIALGLPSQSPLVFLLVSILAVGTLAFAMWHLVEKRFLRRDSHYRRSARPGAEPDMSVRGSAMPH
ncbi:acyltransferase family protein [Sphingomonas changnyeongensis]|uniref:Acyltransferase family protein n=1 Tax=Sphingomonas changnyeongensis TaxID=2698679 RepID=A0A7Z2NUS6_9SPHN|nr:acyltransferase [Sphingomonas changnyeongensis]QHL90218.1 acyltransferase family protein [Sphingomonas changnyeongensis]